MDPRDLDELERFLASVGRPTLFAYYELAANVPAEEADEAIRKRRGWAQGQQSNPRFKSEALFLIKNNGLLRRVLVDQIEAYREQVGHQRASRNLEVLTLFIRGTLTTGQLSVQAEAAILHQGRQLDLADAAVARRIEALLTETGAVRDLHDDDLTADTISVDHYAVLGLDTGATAAQIEQSYRARYRSARSLRDLRRSAEVLQALDDAWRVLRDPTRRARYEEQRLVVAEVGEATERRATLLLADLAEPPTDPGVSLPLRGPAPTGARPAEPPGAPPAMPQSRLGPARESDLGVDWAVRSAPPRPTADGRPSGAGAGAHPPVPSGPRLEVDGPGSHFLLTTEDPPERMLVVRNTGHGAMPGRVASDREWLRVQAPHLDPGVVSQTILVRVDPTGVPWPGRQGTVTIITDHGERHSVTITAARRSRLWMASVLAGGLLLIGASTAALAPILNPPPEPIRSITLVVDPRADRILVNGAAVGTGSRLEIQDPHPGRPFVVRVESGGFVPVEETITLGAGAPTERVVRLELDDPMTWTPPPDQEPARLARSAASELEGAREGLQQCFAGVEGLSEAVAIYKASVTSDGTVRRVEVTVPNFPLAPSESCIRRVFRGLRLSPFSAGYALIEARIAVPVTR